MSVLQNSGIQGVVGEISPPWNGITTVLFAIYLVEIEKKGSIHSLTLSVKSSNTNKPLLYILTLATCAPTLQVCTDIRGAVSSAATPLQE